VTPADADKFLDAMEEWIGQLAYVQARAATGDDDPGNSASLRELRARIAHMLTLPDALGGLR
jgi:hypothetical protein